MRAVDEERRSGDPLSQLSPQLPRQHGLRLHRVRAPQHVQTPPRVRRLHCRGVSWMQ